jgi:predicted N-acetyltransferase YhbS
MNITYQTGITPDTQQIIEVYESAGLNRPTKDAERIQKMYEQSNLIVSAWDGNQLVGVARSLADFCYVCYLADLAVREEYKGKGIGKQLINLTKEAIGEQSTLILLSAPGAMSYYPHIGMQVINNGFIINRKK